ncbi:hypothetical protein B9Z55_016796 [Caenorhabditis nigoni]|uniref:Uncharacterized protein n=1 Tax=Caenorhabditis nigoni TaxID=1611254 RepID=A0A2G5T723_9PELO|nr:hypothetical protein B9Z55_016796 [Caenorhabditis nigoni]
MVAELLITTDMITCFKSCIGQETSMVIAPNIRNLVRYLENFNPQYPGSNVKGGNGFGNVTDKIHDDMKDAILRMNWSYFYEEYIPYIDEIIDKAREQKIIFVAVEHENNWYPNFSSRGNQYHILRETDPERGHPLKSKNSCEMLKFKPARPHYSLNISSPKSSNIENGTNDFSRNSSVTNKPTLFSNISDNVVENIRDNGVGSHIQMGNLHCSNLSSDNSHDSMSPRHNGASADRSHGISRLVVNNWGPTNNPVNSQSLVAESNSNAHTDFNSSKPFTHNGQSQLTGSTNTVGIDDQRNMVDRAKSLTPHCETGQQNYSKPADSCIHKGTSTGKEIKEINYGIQPSEEQRKPVEEVVDSSIVHESVVPSENRFSTPIEHNYEFGSNWQHQTFPGTNSRMRSVSIERNDGPKGFGTVGTVPVEILHHDYSIISSNTMQDTPSQYGTLSDDATWNQTNGYQSLSQFEIPYSPPGTLPAPIEPEAWAEQALNSLRPPTPDEQNPIQEEKYDNEFYSYSADMSCLNHQADEMVEKGKNTREELRAQEENQFYAPLDPNISLESEEDNKSFIERMEQIKAKQREELEEKRRERRKRQAELEEEMRKLRNESKERFRIFISCILLRIRFEEQEQHWMDWITSCRNHIVSLHRYFSIFEQEYHTVFGRKHQPDSDDLEEFQKERRRFHSFLIEVFNDLEDDFGKLNSIEGYSEVLFLRILQSCLANVATELLAIVDLVANLQTDRQSFAELEETISQLRTDKIYSTSKLREICKTSDASENYQNVKFPKLSTEPIIEETY